METILKLRCVSKTFQQRGLVLNNLDFEISPGESVSVMGPSGSGKTTLFNIIGLLDQPDSGTILFKNEPVINYMPDEAALYRNRNIGFVFQDHHLLPYLTIYENIMLPSLAFRNTDSETAAIEEHVRILMEKIGITSLSGKYPFQVSGGEAQRAAIVRALVNSPSLLLADEPTGALDSRNSELLGHLLMEMNRETGITLIVATHSHLLAGNMSRKMKLKDGKLFPSD
jgi:lipoprotein-releasing system ATP-binding protein